MEVRGSTETRMADRNIAALAADGIYRTTHLHALAQSQVTPDRDPREAVTTHVCRLEALRRIGLVELVAEGVWGVRRPG